MAAVFFYDFTPKERVKKINSFPKKRKDEKSAFICFLFSKKYGIIEEQKCNFPFFIIKRERKREKRSWQKE